eukprot:gene7105-5038_t
MILNHFTQHISTERSIIDQGYVYNSYFVLTHHLICVVSKVKTLDRPPGELTVLANMHNIVRLLDVFLRMLAWLVKHFLLAQLFVFVSQKKKIYCHFLIAYNFSFLRSENTNYYSNYLSHFSTFSRNIFAFVFPHKRRNAAFYPQSRVGERGGAEGGTGRLERPPAPPGRNLCLAEKALIVECAVLKFILFVCLFVCLFFAFSTPGSLNARAAPAPRTKRLFPVIGAVSRKNRKEGQGCEATCTRISPHNPATPRHKRMPPPPAIHPSAKPPLVGIMKEIRRPGRRGGAKQTLCGAEGEAPPAGSRQVKVFFYFGYSGKGTANRHCHHRASRYGENTALFCPGEGGPAEQFPTHTPAKDTPAAHEAAGLLLPGLIGGLELLNVSVSCSLGSCLFGLVPNSGTTGSKGKTTAAANATRLVKCSRVNGLIRCGFVESQNFGFQVGADTVFPDRHVPRWMGMHVSASNENELQDFGDGRNWINLLDARWCLLQPPGSGSSARPIKRFRSQSAQHAVDLLLPMKEGQYVRG